VLFENALQFIGTLIAFSIAYVAYKGVRKTQSSSLLRLAAAFVFLGTGFLLQGLYGIARLDLIPGVATILATLLITGLFLETTGYFFLAFSHVLDVLFTKRLGAMLALFPLISINQASIGVILHSLSFYFILYGVVETLFSYTKYRNPNTIIIAFGLGLLAAGWWLSLVGTEFALLRLLQLVMKEIGLLILFIPVLKFSFGKGRRLDGPV
jgi:hypothetical protein